VIEVRVPDEQEGTKAVVRSWLKQVGDEVAENDPLVELETDKVTQEVPAPAAGVLSEIVLDTDAEAVPGALLARIETASSPAKAGAQEAKPAAAWANEAAPGPRPSPGNTESRLSPSVRRACLQNGIDPGRIEGTGRNGRVTREDVDRAVASATVVAVGEPATAQPRQLSPQDIPHDRMRLAIAENMVPIVSDTSFSLRAPKYCDTRMVPPTVRPDTIITIRLVTCAPLDTPASALTLSTVVYRPTIHMSATL
jgi:2-oxoglutarate dehydrogenase E2 component (dihydrolipoamide succinyltransferase)